MTKKYKYIIAGSVIVSLLSIAVYATSPIFRQFSSESWVPHNPWHFENDGVTGNAGRVSFIKPWTSAGTIGDSLVGTFWIETIWTGTFNPGTMFIAPTDPNAPVDEPWTISGTIDSNAGTIYLTWVRYIPNENVLIWTGWNNGIGSVPFWSDDLGTYVTNTGIARWFVWRVKILGTIDGDKSFQTYDNSVGIQYNASLMNQMLNKIRKNVSLLTRNMKSDFTNVFNALPPTALGNKIFYINTGSVYQALTYIDGSSIASQFPSSSIDSLILVWWDILIGTGIYESYPKKYPKGIIVLKNEKGVGWNIYIAPDVKIIESSLFAEGTIYSGTDKDNIENATMQQVASLPENQLYIHGSLMSRNTIGGALEFGGAVCPYNEITCDYASAIKFDLNYFRNYLASGSLTAATRAYSDDTFDNYSMIIEYDSRISTNPPPGFEMK